MKKNLLTIAALFLILSASAQKNIYLSITHKLGNSNFAFNQTATNNLSQDFKITRVDYYISSIKIIHDGGVITNVPNKYILVKGSANVNALLGNFNVTNVEGIKFSIGVESPTNNADPALWPASHPLAPQSPSMHWGWSAGYRFIALEGLAGTTFNTVFQMHGLGNANYFEQTQMATGVNSGSDVNIYLDADYIQAVKNINLQAGPIDHGVNASDLVVLNNFRDFVFSPGTGTTGIDDLGEQTAIALYPNPSNGVIYLDNGVADIKAERMMVIDELGRAVIDQELLPAMNTIRINSTGAYTAVLMKGNEVLSRKLVIIQ